MGLFEFPATKELKEAISDTRVLIRNADGAITDLRHLITAIRAAASAFHEEIMRRNPGD